MLDDHLNRIREEDGAQLSAKQKKKGKGSEAGKRKAPTQISRGVDKLKKTSTIGMSKLSSFFQKPTK